MCNITEYSEKTFEDIKHINEYGEEFWYARELQTILEYKEWRNFVKVIDKAKTACENSSILVEDHFVDVNKMVEIGSRAEREVEDIQLSRYACYLIMQNGDPRKKVRQTIKDLGGTMPEDLPTPAKSIKQIEKENTKEAKLELK